MDGAKYIGGKGVCVIVVAAGSGRRFGAPLPKQYCDMDGRPVLMVALERIKTVWPEAEVLLVINDDYRGLWLEMCGRHDFESPRMVSGGDTRWQSVRNALDVMPRGVDVVAVHDAARPMFTPEVGSGLIDAICAGKQGAIPVVLMVDSLRRVDGDGGSKSVDRAEFRAVQTPQLFRADLLVEAYSRPYSSVMTDDASVMEAAGYMDIALTEGDEALMKITRPHDIEIVRMLAKEM